MLTKIEALNMVDIQRDLWNKFLLNNPNQASVFHTQEWMQTLQEAHGYEPKYLTMMTEDHSFIAAIPFMIDIRFGIKNYLSMPYDTYGGVIGDIEIASHLINKFLRLPGIGVRYYVDYTNKSIVCKDYVSLKQSTELMDISEDVDVIWKKLHKDNRTAIRFANNYNVTTRITSEYLNIFDKIPQNLVKSILNNMCPEYCVQYIADIDNVCVAASLFFIYGDMAMYWANTTTELGRKTNSNYLLLWSAIQYAKLKGCTTFNFGSSPSGANNLIKFKKSWGTNTYTYTKYQKTPFLIKPLLVIKEVIHG